MSEQLKKIQSEVDEMNKSFGDPIEELEPELVPEPEPEPEPILDSESNPKLEPEPIEPEPEPEPPVDEKDKVIDDLRKQLAEKVVPEIVKQSEPEPPFKVDEQDFVGDLDPSDITKEDLNKLLNKVFSSGVELATKTVKTTIPAAVSETIEVKEQMQKLNDQFYADNEDLKSFQKVVGVVFGELATDDPKKSIGEILKATSLEVRKRLGLPEYKKKEEKKEEEKKGGLPPKLPGKKGTSGQSRDDDNKPTGIEAELAEMNKILGR
jgi:hypothetical protein